MRVISVRNAVLLEKDCQQTPPMDITSACMHLFNSCRFGNSVLQEFDLLIVYSVHMLRSVWDYEMSLSLPFPSSLNLHLSIQPQRMTVTSSDTALFHDEFLLFLLQRVDSYKFGHWSKLYSVLMGWQHTPTTSREESAYITSDKINKSAR